MLTFFIIIAVWFLVGLAVALAFGMPLNRAIQTGFVSLIFALVWVATTILPSEYRSRMFFEGPKPEEKGGVAVGCFIVAPVIILLITGPGWLAIYLVNSLGLIQ